MCGGSVEEKIRAAFWLANISGEMTGDELSTMIATVFGFARTLTENLDAGNYITLVAREDHRETALATTQKCFEELRIPFTHTIHYR